MEAIRAKKIPMITLIEKQEKSVIDFQKGGKLFVKKTLFILVLLCQVAFVYPPLPEARSESEALYVRRIIDFWRDKEYPFAKSQIRAFIISFAWKPLPSGRGGNAAPFALL